MSKMKTRREAHRRFAAELRERKRQRRANREMLEAKGIDTSPVVEPVLEMLEDTPAFTMDELLSKSKAELTARAEASGMTVKSKTTKAQMAEFILANGD